MPDQYGNPTPQEMLANLHAQHDDDLDRARSTSDRRSANLRAIGRALTYGMNPNVVKAREIEAALKAPMALTRNEGESSLDFLLRQSQMAFDRVKNVDPTTAAEIVSQMTKLEEERATRSRLQAQEGRAVAQEAREVSEFEASASERRQGTFLHDQLFLLDRSLPPAEAYKTARNLQVSDPTTSALIDAARQENPQIAVLDWDAFHDIYDDSASAKLTGSAANPNTPTQFNKDWEETVAHGTGLKVAEGLFTLYADPDFNPIDDIAKVENVINMAAEDLISLRQAAASTNYDEATGENNAVLNQRDAEAFIEAKKLEGNAMAKVLADSQLVRMAFALAKSLDPGGRLSDADFERAWEMLGAGSRSPAASAAAIMSNVRQTTIPTFEAFRRRYNPETWTDNPQAKTMYEELDAQEGTIPKLEELYQAILDQSRTGVVDPMTRATVRRQGPLVVTIPEN